MPNSEDEIGSLGFQAAYRLAKANVSTIFIIFNETETSGQLLARERNCCNMRQAFEENAAPVHTQLESGVLRCFSLLNPTK